MFLLYLNTFLRIKKWKINVIPFTFLQSQLTAWGTRNFNGGAVFLNLSRSRVIILQDDYWKSFYFRPQKDQLTPFTVVVKRMRRIYFAKPKTAKDWH